VAENPGEEVQSHGGLELTGTARVDTAQ